MSDTMTVRFRVDIAFEEGTELYHANLYSISDGKGVPLKNASLRKLLNRVTKLIRDKNSEVRHFPLPEQNLIVSANGHDGVRIIERI